MTETELVKNPRRSRMVSAEIKALREIVRGFNQLETLQDENVVRAALNYIDDRYGKWLKPHNGADGWIIVQRIGARERYFAPFPEGWVKPQ